jgi:hypothetical protein
MRRRRLCRSIQPAERAAGVPPQCSTHLAAASRRCIPPRHLGRISARSRLDLVTGEPEVEGGDDVEHRYRRAEHEADHDELAGELAAEGEVDVGGGHVE